MTIAQFEIIALLTALAALWEQFLALARWPRRLLVVKRECCSDAAGALTAYLTAHARRRHQDGARYTADRYYVRELGRTSLVVSESLRSASQTFWLRGRPIWYAFTDSDTNHPTAYAFFFLRWSLDWERLLIASEAWCDEEALRLGRRHTITTHGGQKFAASEGSLAAPSGSDRAEYDPHEGKRPLRWAVESLGRGTRQRIEDLALCPQGTTLAEDVGRFIRGRDWYEDRGVPWRRGWHLHGKPGTGKTSLVRALAVEHDLPVHEFDLGSMDNEDLRRAWNAMQLDAPCVALIEDVDGVYGTQNDAGEWDCRALRREGPTFDALLRCIGGITIADGVLLFVTTNHPERVDPALRRGGRLDVEVGLTGLDDAGREQIAQRILQDETAARAAAVDPTMQGLSPADFQEALCRRALAERFAE